MLDFGNNVKVSFIKPETEQLLLMEPTCKFDPFSWLEDYKNLIDECLIKYDGVLLRNFGLQSISEFSKMVKMISPDLLDYTSGSTPRTKLGDKIYTATEYPADRIIQLHNENSYSNSWGRKKYFSSVLQQLLKVEETPIASSRNVYKKLDNSVKDKFERYGVLYVRNFHSGIDLSWQELCQSDDKGRVDQYCTDNNIDFLCNKSGPQLTIKQKAQESLLHKKSMNCTHLVDQKSL